MTDNADARAARLAIAERLWDTLKDLNRDDVHGVRALAVQAPGSAYQNVTDALHTVLLTLVDSEDRANRVYSIALDAYEDIAHALGYEAKEWDTVQVEQAHADGRHTGADPADRAHFEQTCADCRTERDARSGNGTMALSPNEQRVLTDMLTGAYEAYKPVRVQWNRGLMVKVGEGMWTPPLGSQQ